MIRKRKKRRRSGVEKNGGRKVRFSNFDPEKLGKMGQGGLGGPWRGVLPEQEGGLHSGLTSEGGGDGGENGEGVYQRKSHREYLPPSTSLGEGWTRP